MIKQGYLFVIFILLIVFNSHAQIAKPTGNIAIAEHYEGGQDSMYAFIQRNIKYPPMAKRNRIQGECIVHIVLNADGKTSGISVVKNIGGGCGEEAGRVAKLLKFKAPGYKFQTSIPIIFKL
jgi:protein TonB